MRKFTIGSILLSVAFGCLLAGCNGQNEVKHETKQETEKQVKTVAKEEKTNVERSFKITPGDFLKAFSTLSGYYGNFSGVIPLETGTAHGIHPLKSTYVYVQEMNENGYINGGQVAVEDFQLLADGDEEKFYDYSKDLIMVLLQVTEEEADKNLADLGLVRNKKISEYKNYTKKITNGDVAYYLYASERYFEFDVAKADAGIIPQ